MNFNYHNSKMSSFKDYIEFMKIDGMFPVIGIKVDENAIEEGLIDSLEVFKALSRIRNIKEFTEKEIVIINEITKIKNTDEWTNYENWFKENLPKLNTNDELKPLENNFVESKIMKVRENYETFKKILKESEYMK